MEKIKNYLINNRNQKPEVAARIVSPFGKHDDVRAELEGWIDQQEYPKNDPLTIEGYTAEAISKLAPFMDGVGVYNFMVTLRERPDNAKKIIADGFPRLNCPPTICSIMLVFGITVLVLYPYLFAN